MESDKKKRLNGLRRSKHFVFLPRAEKGTKDSGPEIVRCHEIKEDAECHAYVKYVEKDRWWDIT
jgi:hypothetical protein